MALRSVIIGDIVGSTKLSKEEFKKLLKELSIVLQPYQYEFFRGDSLQVFLKSPDEALRVLLQLRCASIKLNSLTIVTDVRACIGLGEAKSTIKQLNTATDEAFVISGRAFDAMRSPQRLLIVCSANNEGLQLGLQILADYIDYIFRHLTSKQAAVLAELLQKRTQAEAAKRLKKTQATINRHAQAAGWQELEKLLLNYQNLISLIKL